MNIGVHIKSYILQNLIFLEKVLPREILFTLVGRDQETTHFTWWVGNA